MTYKIDDTYTFTVTTHTVTTGALTDADSVPTYRVYEEETGTAILSGSMAKLDDANTTGHYSEQLTLSAANGFEADKTYNIYITATVNSVAGGTVRHFQVVADPATAAALTTHDGKLDTVDGIVDAILLDTAEIGAAGAGLTAVPWNAAWDAEVQSEATDALNAYDPPTKAELDAGLAALNDPTAATIADAVLDEALAGHVGAGTLGKAVADIETDATAILADTNELQTNQGNWATADVSGLATAAALATVDANVDAILVDTDTTIPGLIAALNNLSAAQVNAEVVDVLRTDTIPDSYPTDGAQPTIAQALLVIQQFLTEKSVSGTTLTVKKPDGSTTAMTFTLDSGTAPTSITRAS